MTREETLRSIMRQKGRCMGISCISDACPFSGEETFSGLNCSNYKSSLTSIEWYDHRLSIAKELLAESSDVEDRIKELENKQLELEGEINKLKGGKVKSKFKAFHFYKSDKGQIVFCTDKKGVAPSTFKGIKVDDCGLVNAYGIGCTSEVWAKEAFFEVTPMGWEKV